LRKEKIKHNVEKVSTGKDKYHVHEHFGVLSYVIINLTRHRWRTFLTITGIAIPIAFFVLFAAMGNGLDQYIISQSSAADQTKYDEMSKIVSSWTNVLMIIIAIMIVTSIINTILMSTSERKFEFGILKALGISQDQIVLIVIIEAFLISLFALIVGVILGIWGSIVFDYLFWVTQGSWVFFAPAEITFNSIIIASILTLVIGTITAIYPALSVSKLNTIEILRSE